jgi:hemoglobin
MSGASGPPTFGEANDNVDPFSEIFEHDIALLVSTFYGRALADPYLGPIFIEQVADWPEHIVKLTAFWSSALLKSGTYTGRPVPAHLPMKHLITPELMARWQAIWREVTDALMPVCVAAALQRKAQRMGTSLNLAIQFDRAD